MAFQQSSYIVTPKACTNPRARLICFPHSGGGPSSFASWPDVFDDLKVEVVAISMPGHERRIDSAPISDLEALVAEICDALTESGIVDDVPFAFFGHSLGAVIACEVARRLDNIMIPQRPRPIHVFASAHAGPSQAVTNRGSGALLHKMDVSDLLKAVEQFGFLPAELLANQGLVETVVPALQADFQIYESYVPDANRAKLPCPITALGGQEDKAVGGNVLQCWAEETSRELFGPIQLPGGHFYLFEESREGVLKLLAEHIERSMNCLPRSLEKSQCEIPDYVYKMPVQEVVRMRMGKHPDLLAVVDEHESVTYKELVRRMDMMALDMHQRFLFGERQKVVALLTQHDITYVVGMLAIFAADAIANIIEAHFPPDLAKEIALENGTCMALTSPDHSYKFSEWCPVYELGSNWLAELEARNAHFDNMPEVKMEDHCILMMTSGTTGRPKAIVGTHFFLTLGQHAKTLQHPYEANSRHAHSVMFVWEVLQPLMYEALTSYILPDSATLDPHIFVGFCERHKITHVLTTPSLMNTILQYCATGLSRRLQHMSTWWTCGEVLSMNVVHKFKEVLPKVRMINDYSTWEAGDIAYAVIDPERLYTPSKTFSAAGAPAPGTILAIIDPETQELVPRGVCGELYCGGIAVSSGYFSLPEASKERFVKGFNKDMLDAWQGTWYKSGDLCRFVGEPPIMEIRGRMDSTVKIRGFKVGIPVVEASLQEVPGVAICGIVPVYSSPGIVECLCAFIACHEGFRFESVVQTIKREGPKRIPRWMLPSYYKAMPGDTAEFISGGESKKLNRKKLAASVSFESLKAEAEAAAQNPEGDTSEEEIEKSGGVRGIVRAVWAKTLTLNEKTLDLDENFFDLGGHSTLAARLAADLSGDYGLNVTVLDIYSNSTLGQLLDFLDPQPSIVAVPEPLPEIRAPLRPGQETGLAIVGLAGRFPGANDAEGFWRNIQTGAVSATFLSPALLKGKGVPQDVIDNKEFVRCAYMMNDVDKFDHLFFGIGKHEASLMDPQHRVFIETSWSALENAALPPRTGFGDETVGVFAAAGIDGYLVHHLDGAPLKDAMNPQDVFFAEIGNEKDYIATRVAYLMDFTGPAMNVNSACSSALVACAQAGAAISFGQCDAAVAGASSVTFPNLGYLYQDGLVSSTDGYVRPFDKSADGTVFGDSVGAVVLRRSDDVRKSEGLMWASLLGFSVTNDGGQKAGYAAPSSVGQSRAVVNALRMSGVDPWSLSYVECHATGTKIGDGIEVRGLIDSFNQVGGKKGAGEASVALGSVKGNIAHANCAAGVTGLIKLLSMLKSKQLTPTANFRMLNPKVDLTGTPFQVNTELGSWDIDGRPRRAGVSSFGIGGTNAHCILEEAPPVTSERQAAKSSFKVLPFSAKSPESLLGGFSSLAAKMRNGAEEGVFTDVDAAAWTLQKGRSALPLRKAIVVPCTDDEANAEQSKAVASAIVAASPSLDDLEDLEEAVKRPGVAFVFPGQGSQYLGMGSKLYDEVPLYQQTVDHCCERLMAPDLLGRDIRPILFSKDRGEEFSEPSVLQPCLFVTEYAMAQLLQAVGVTPVAAGGHSLGEYVAATMGGLLSLDDALKIVASRAKATETLAKDGAMLAVLEWSDEELQSIIQGAKKGLWLAAINSPVHAVISGEISAVETLEAELKAAGRKCTRLQIRKAFHSGLIAEAADTLDGLGLPDESAAASANIPITSNVTGGWMNASLLKDGKYWSNHMRNGVMWRSNAESLVKQWQPAIVLEVGPGNALSMLTKKCIPKGDTAPTFLQAMRHPKSTDVHDVEVFLGMLGQLWEAGCDIRWEALHTRVFGTPSPPALMRLPPYSFKKISLWEKPERSVYVEGDVKASASESLSLALKGPAAHKSAALVRYGDKPGREPSLRAYCLPFAGGSSGLFAPWAEQADVAVEIIAVEMPGRGGRTDDKLPSSDADDATMIDELCRAILADVRGAQYVLVGFSMGGNLSVEMTLRLAAMNAQMPLALYVAGRKPPAADPSTISALNMSDDALASYAMASPDVVRSIEFREHVLPKLRADLELDLRIEKRLSAMCLSGKRVPAEVGFEAFCGTADQVAPWTAAQEWHRLMQSPMPIGVHFMPGGHEFLIETRPMLLAAWRQNAVGRFVQRQIAELAVLGFAPGGAAAPAPPPTAPAASSTLKSELPFYAVRWVPPALSEPTPSMGASATSSECPFNGSDQPTAVIAPPFVVHMNRPLALNIIEMAIVSLQTGSPVVVVSKLGLGVLESTALDDELKQCWRFIHLVQSVLDAEVSGRIIIACEASNTGGMVVGASKAVAMEASELKIQRVFLPRSILEHDRLENIVKLTERYSKESDIWVQDATMEDTASWTVFVQRLENTLEPSVKLPCVPKWDSNGEPAVYVLTGATGGLGSAVVDWLVNNQELSPEQLVLLRRAGSTQLTGILSKCRIVECAAVDSFDDLLKSGLKDLRSVAGIFHLAGVLDDGIIQGMTEERVCKVAKPKCGIALSLLRVSVALGWGLKWFLGFSSTSSLFGYGGQVNYSAANGMLDQMAVFGASGTEKLPCRIITINWGPWGEAGMAKVGTKAYEQAVKEGDTPLKTATALRCLAAALRSAGRAQQESMQFCACDVEWQRSHWRDLPILDLVAERGEAEVVSIPEVLSSDAPVSGRSSLEEFMASYTSQAWTRIRGKSLVKIGLDSLEVVQLRNQYNKHFGVNVPLRVFADPSQTLNELVSALEATSIAVIGGS